MKGKWKISILSSFAVMIKSRFPDKIPGNSSCHLSELLSAVVFFLTPATNFLQPASE
jgi:hypothetical protein